MDKKKRKREIIIKIGDLYDSHPEVGFISKTNCKCAVCKEIRSLGVELETLNTDEEIRRHKKYKVTVNKNGSELIFSSLLDASIYIGKSKGYLHSCLGKDIFNLKTDDYDVKIETLKSKYKKESVPK
ncbi:hypothetical protein [Brochothrix thermosphacta]|uniref:hypothetical protein n=1 Tax=Brochothrix thermosphacta TaxID=2756 RepID=UPI00265CAF87|nr:hypothetical protein [Brochothrix thermosphacta]WKK68312.1 hypothetical protein Q0G00_08290 [Brochothrix thermosphacta]